MCREPLSPLSLIWLPLPPFFCFAEPIQGHPYITFGACFGGSSMVVFFALPFYPLQPHWQPLFYSYDISNKSAFADHRVIVGGKGVVTTTMCIAMLARGASYWPMADAKKREKMPIKPIGASECSFAGSSPLARRPHSGCSLVA